MQHLEEVFGVSLFVRGKNKIMLNDTGIKAVEQARQLLSAADNALKTVRAFDKSLHTITISSCAPSPLWYVLPVLSSAYPDMTIASSIKSMPASRFLVQTDLFAFEELVRESSLPCFTTNLAKDGQSLLTDRIKIPVTDPEANVTYYLACHSQSTAYTDALKRIDINDIL